MTDSRPIAKHHFTMSISTMLRHGSSRVSPTLIFMLNSTFSLQCGMGHASQLWAHSTHTHMCPARESTEQRSEIHRSERETVW
jgi:hypothetical protein